MPSLARLATDMLSRARAAGDAIAGAARSPPPIEPAAPGLDPMLGAIAELTRTRLQPIVREIDEGPFYPGDVLRAFGAAGAYRSHLPSVTGAPLDLYKTIAAMTIAGEECLATSFCMWCQATLAWYVENTENAALKSRYAARAAAAELLGGTGLSNPMKSFFGIETFRLKGTPAEGGYRVKGLLPWVSNLGPDHAFGTVFEVPGEPARRVMALIPCDHPGVTLVDAGEHLALDGTGTYSVQIRDALIPPELILADPAEPYVKKVRAGFVLLQTGMAFGVIKGCTALMHQARTSLGHVNKYLDEQPEEIEAERTALEATVRTLAADPYATEPGYWRAVLEARLAASHLSLKAAQAAMLHCGARGYVRNGAAQRRLREAYFVAIVTPATKQLKKMLSDLDAGQSASA